MFMHRNIFPGLAILIIGVVFLLENLGIITSSVWDIIWPSLIIALGLGMLLKRI